ncbi:MAG: OmpH family outer membrane protein [Alphaproteobacteria bacterium]|jgi:outer membrane protein|nr:OmpH family outer membrane protein [Alphaproteobacteria bacterium]
MTKTIAIALLGTILSTTAIAAPPPPPPPPKIVVLDKVAILQFSKVGQDVARQVQGYAAQAKSDLTAQGKSLQAEGRTLQQQIAILAPDVKAKRIASFQAREQALQGAAQKKDEQIKAGFFQARQAIEQKLGPILQQVVKERGANIVLDKQAIVMATVGGYDITADVIGRLNQQMPTYKVNLNAPPAPAAARK